jgi:hypothetical protein
MLGGEQGNGTFKGLGRDIQSRIVISVQDHATASTDMGSHSAAANEYLTGETRVTSEARGVLNGRGAEMKFEQRNGHLVPMR